jgi:trehalose 6-phosphate phosphatase
VRDILGSSGLRVLREALAAQPLLGFDFDGTLAPIVADPALASLRVETGRLLTSVGRRFPVGVISGRARDDVSARLRRVPLVALFGNHGAERSGPIDASLRARVRLWADALRGSLADLDGVDVEDKGLTLAVHYRRSARQALARERILAACSGLPRARVFGGHCVVNVAPAQLPRKSDALHELRARMSATHVLYVGDDETDEDAFAVEIEGLVSVRVGNDRPSCARFFLETQRHMDDLLRAILQVSAARPPRGVASSTGA